MTRTRIGTQHAQSGPWKNVGRRAALVARYRAVRRASEALCAPLAVEDYGLQAMPATSPPKWHLAHTSWFFETFLLKPFVAGYRPFHPQFEYLFNSYYEAVGPQYPRPARGLLTRPTVEQVYHYRVHVDEALAALMDTAGEDAWPQIAARLALGCHHEEQHQELLLTDVKYGLSINPLRPAYRDDLPGARDEATALAWTEYPGGVQQIGHDDAGFAFDNETPRHRVFVAPYALATRLVTAGEYLEFIEADGYRRAEYWLADGWQAVREHGWQAPLYWERRDGRWWQYTLGGMRPVDAHAPVCHVSWYEADAYARFRGRRLPGETEWEIAAAAAAATGNFRESGFLHPVATTATGGGPAQFFGDVWEWTRSAYAPYPGFRPDAGALGEYNGKFMANQTVLRGGSCVTPAGHVRATYRNFFYPPDRWQFSGIRLAEDR